MKLASKPKFITGIIILALFVISYFIKFNVEEGANYKVKDTLLGIMIFHSPLVLLIYLAITAALIISGIRKVRFI